MKRIVALVAALVVVAAAASANAAEPSKSGLSAMGLPGLKVMTDAEGSKVRGTFAVVYGSSTSSTNSVSLFGNSASSATSTNSYLAGGNYVGAGINGSTAYSSGSLFSSSATAGGFSAAFGF